MFGEDDPEKKRILVRGFRKRMENFDINKVPKISQVGNSKGGLPGSYGHVSSAKGRLRINFNHGFSLVSVIMRMGNTV